MSRIKRHTISFRHAFDGIVYTFKTQPNFKIHTLAAVLVLSLSWFLSISSYQLIILLFVIGLVLAAEMINTSIESVVDLVTDKFHHQAKIAKDISAGMVLMSSFVAFLIGIIILLPPLLELLISR